MVEACCRTAILIWSSHIEIWFGTNNRKHSKVSRCYCSVYEWYAPGKWKWNSSNMALCFVSFLYTLKYAEVTALKQTLSPQRISGCSLCFTWLYMHGQVVLVVVLNNSKLLRLGLVLCDSVPCTDSCWQNHYQDVTLTLTAHKRHITNSMIHAYGHIQVAWHSTVMFTGTEQFDKYSDLIECTISDRYSLWNRGLELQPKLQPSANMQTPCQLCVSTKQTLENTFGQRILWYDFS